MLSVISVSDSKNLFDSLIDYICISGTMERNVLEYVDHLHEHFVTPCSVNNKGRYNVPTNPKEGYRYVFWTRLCSDTRQLKGLAICTASRCTKLALIHSSGGKARTGLRGPLQASFFKHVHDATWNYSNRLKCRHEKYVISVDARTGLPRNVFLLHQELESFMRYRLIAYRRPDSIDTDKAFVDQEDENRQRLYAHN